MDNIKELALFAGAGGGILGGRLLGWTTVCAVECDPYAASVLVARQNDGMLDAFPIWDDVRTFDGNPWRGIVDVVSGGFPCQDISAAGKGAGIDGERSGLWREFARIIREVRPRYAFLENSPMLLSRGLGRVLGDLAEIGYDAVWTVLGADDVGAPHRRKRIWILAADARRDCVLPHAVHGRAGRGEQLAKGPIEKISDADGERGTAVNIIPEDSRGTLENQAEKQPFRTDRLRGGFPDAENERALRREWELRDFEETSGIGDDIGRRTPLYGRREWWDSEPDVGRVAHGVAHRVDRLRCIGNGQVPLCAATALKILFKNIKQKQ